MVIFAAISMAIGITMFFAGMYAVVEAIKTEMSESDVLQDDERNSDAEPDADLV